MKKNSCSLESNKINSLATIRQLVTKRSGDKDNAISIDNENVVRVSIGKHKNIQTLNEAYTVAKKIVQKIEDWATKEFGKEFSKGWTTEIEQPNDLFVKFKYQFSPILEASYRIQPVLLSKIDITSPEAQARIEEGLKFVEQVAPKLAAQLRIELNRPDDGIITQEERAALYNEVYGNESKETNVEDFYNGDEALKEQDEREYRYEYSDEDESILESEDVSKSETLLNNLQERIKLELPIEIVNTVTIVDDVPKDILGRKDLYFSIKDILNNNGINDKLLINWLGINNNQLKIHPNTIKSEQQIINLIQKQYNQKKIANNHPVLKTNKLALESFNKWITALEQFPLPFQDQMLSHAIKYLNPQRNRTNKYVLQLSQLALQDTYVEVINQPHKLNQAGKIYDKAVLATVSDAVGHELSESGRGYWIHIPRVAGSAIIEHRSFIRDNTNDPNAPAKFTVEYISEIDNDLEIEFFETKEEAEKFVENLGVIGNKAQAAQHKVNVELLRKLSPSTWCTSGSMASHYVENYDNYLLVVNGVTVVGIEAYPSNDNFKNQNVLDMLYTKLEKNNNISSEDLLSLLIKENIIKKEC